MNRSRMGEWFPTFTAAAHRVREGALTRVVAAILAACCGVSALYASAFSVAWFSGALCRAFGDGSTTCKDTYPLALLLFIPVVLALGGAYAGGRVAITGERWLWPATILIGLPFLIACLVALWIERDNII